MAFWRNTTFGADSVLVSPEESASAGDKKVLRRIIVPGNARIQAELDFVGYPIVKTGRNPFNGIAARWISRVTPHPYSPAQQVIRGNGQAGAPGSPSLDQTKVSLNPWVWCRSVPKTSVKTLPSVDTNFIGMGVDEELTLEYRSLDWDVKEDSDPEVVGQKNIVDGLDANWLTGLPDESRLARYCSRFYKPAGRFYRLPAGMVSWVLFPDEVPAGKNRFRQIPESATVHEPRVGIVIVMHEWPATAVPWTAMTQLQGCVNSLPFDTFRFRPGGLPPQTVLYNTWDVKEGRSIDGKKVFEIFYSFTFSPNCDFGSIFKELDPWSGQPIPDGPYPRGWNYSVTRLLQAATFGSGVIWNDYRPISGVAIDGFGKPSIGNPLCRIADLSALFRPVQP
jgi:hypothetical protein